MHHTSATLVIVFVLPLLISAMVVTRNEGSDVLKVFPGATIDVWNVGELEILCDDIFGDKAPNVDIYNNANCYKIFCRNKN